MVRHARLLLLLLAWTTACQAPDSRGLPPAEQVAPGVRLYRLDSVSPPTGVPGCLRRAVDDDLDCLIGWFEDFHVEVGDPAPGGPEGGAEAVRRRIADDQLWLWDDGGAVCYAGAGIAIGGVAAVGPVFTPVAKRRRGYASACVAAVAACMLDQGVTPVLYTDLGNPTSNSIYRRIGFRAVNEGVRYDFIPPRPNPAPT